MDIWIIRKQYSPWGINGECHINGRKVCDTVEHPKHCKPPGMYEINKQNFKDFIIHGDGPMKSLNGEITVGRYALKGLVIQSRQVYNRLNKRIKKALERKNNVCLIIK